MSGQYTNHSKTFATSSTGRVWNHNNSTKEGIDSHGMSLSGSNFNDPAYYSQATITCSPHISVQIAHTKNSTNCHTPETLLSNTVDSLPKATTPLLSLQMLVENRQNQIKNLSDKKDFFETVLNANTSNSYQKVSQENQICFTSKNIDKIHESDNISISHLSNNECQLLDAGLSTISSNTTLSTINNKNESNFNRDKDIVFKSVSVNFDINKTEINYNSHDKSIDNIKLPSSILKFSPDVTIEKVDTDKINIEIPKDIDVSKLNLQTKNLVPTTITLISKSNQRIKNDIQELHYDKKKKTNEFTLKAKNFSKKGKKGVDSLLEKLESCNKKMYTIDNLGSIQTINIDEKDTNSIRSMSPEYCKSRSPNNRDDDVVSPSFSNDDSNDTKQRRKRKLGKPIRLSKDFKLEHEDLQLKIVNLRNKFENLNHLSKNVFSQDSLLSTYTQNKESSTSTTVFDMNKKSNIQTYLMESKKSNDLKLKNFDLREVCAFKDNDIVNKEENKEGIQNDLILKKKKYKIEMNQYLIQTLKNTKCIRTRRSSECYVNLYNKNKKKRRKSCDDIRDFFHESAPSTTITNNISAFNEVESQLEKMFAGIIETDKDLFKKNMFETEKSVILSDEEQKENMNLDKLVTENVAKNTCTETTNNNYKNIKKKNNSKIRSHKKKTNSCKEIINDSMNSLHKDKKRCVDRRSLKKSCNLRKKTKCIKLDTLREIIYDSSINSNPIKYKGPIIQIRGSKINSLFVEIINAPREDDEEKSKEKRKSLGNGNVGRSKRLHYQNNIDYRGKFCNTGLFNSTLSVRYDAHTADVTWICVFCKRGPHFIIPGDSARPHPFVVGPHITPGAYTVPAGVLSDLFGPYIIGREIVEDNIMSPDEYEIMKEQTQGNKNKRSLRYAGLADQFIAKVHKKKKKFLNNLSNNYTGMTMLGCDEQRWEVWLHEECIIWATGVYITGGRISGLEDAVWDASKSICNSCGLSGANIGCIKRGCKSVTHYCCALTSGWELDINQYIPKCNIHRIS